MHTRIVCQESNDKLQNKMKTSLKKAILSLIFSTNIIDIQ